MALLDLQGIDNSADPGIQHSTISIECSATSYELCS